MTKSGLIEEVAKRTPHISKKDTEVVVNTIFDSMTQALKEQAASEAQSQTTTLGDLLAEKLAEQETGGEETE